jgi:4-amino-4-deoxy-L-arabinose transferase-like glycosyltransferase
MIISLLVIFTFAIKFEVFTKNRNIEIIPFVLSFGFICPYFWSVSSFLAMSTKYIYHTSSLLIYITSLLFGGSYLTIFPLILSSLIEYQRDRRKVNLINLIIFNCIIGIAFIYGIRSVIELSPNLLYVFSFENNFEYH